MAYPDPEIVITNTTLGIGGTTLVTFTFDQSVSGFTNADLTVANGSLSTLNALNARTYTATLTPDAGVSDSSNIIIFDNSGVLDAGGVRAGDGLTLSPNYIVDTVRPTATILLADNALAVGQTTLVTFTFSEAVTGFANADLTVGNGTLSGVTSGDGGITYTATLTPTAGLNVSTNAITLGLSGVADLAGNAGTGAATSANYLLDSIAPTAAVVVADNALAAGETSLVTITFSEAVTGFSNADLAVANGTLSSVSSADGGISYTATFTPAVSTLASANVITLANTGLTDLAGNAGAGSTASNTYAIDTARPTATIVLADGSLTAGETSAVTITFSEAVTGFANDDLTVEGGALSAVATSDNITYTATFTPTAALSDGTNVITLANSGVADAVGNPGTGTSVSANYVVNTIPPQPDPDPAPPVVPVVAPGTTAPDLIVGDAQDNVIAAGGGDDSASGGSGGDSISGDAGDDHLQGNSGADNLAGGTGDDVVLGGQDNDQVQGNTDNDYVSGDKGADTVHGGQGNDQVLGGDGDDYVSGDRGSDTVTGGGGADLFHGFGEAGMDLITDFSLAEGDRVILDFGTTYSVSQVGADTVIDMTGGGQMILAGVKLSTLTPGWIFAG
jgi:Ca2+-binding RTX toxin-like protein